MSLALLVEHPKSAAIPEESGGPGCSKLRVGHAVGFKPQLETAESFAFPAGFESANALKQVRDDPVPGMPPGKHIIIAWFNHDLEDLANALACFTPNGSKATVICANELEVSHVPDFHRPQMILAASNCGSA